MRAPMCAMRDPAQGTTAPPTSPDTTITARSLSPIQPSTPSSSPQPWAIQVHRKLIRTRRLRNKCSEAKPECRITKLQIATTTDRLIDIAQRTNTNNGIRVPLSDPDQGTTAPPTPPDITTRNLSPLQPSTPCSSPQTWASHVHRKLINTVSISSNRISRIRKDCSEAEPEFELGIRAQQIATTTERLIGIAQRTNTNNEVERPSVYGIDAAVRDKGTRATFSHNLCALTESGD